MSRSLCTRNVKVHTCAFPKILLVLIALTLARPVLSATRPNNARGVYFPSSSLSGRSFDGIVHYIKAAGLNLAVLHAKDPMGRLFWKSKNSLAEKMGASARSASLETAVAALKQKGIRIAAKVDVFQDSLLVKTHPEFGVANSETGDLWADRKGLHWANPYDRRVWEYTVALCGELVEIGVDEIQFDYVRFPSDGNMSTIAYPVKLEDTSQQECIGEFLAYANSQLKPSGVAISVDLFGLVAWKKDDFGVGQVLEKIVPHVDVLCPMLYPSHFPNNFLSLKNPSQYPYRIMKQSLEEMKKRTNREIRPWIQGFWYTPEEINAQLQGVDENGIQSWAVWNPTGRYAQTFSALAIRARTQFPEPEFYPALEELRSREDMVTPGLRKIVNHTCYREGYTTLSLDEPMEGRKSKYATIMDVLSTLDESIIDRILSGRGFALSPWTSRYTKATHLAGLICKDLGIDPRNMRPAPIHVDWSGGYVFTKSIPLDRWEAYQSHSRDLQSVIAGFQR